VGAGAIFLVLLVDDLEDGRAMYAEYLTRSGYRVVQAADGRQAVALAIALLPDVVVMDMALPILDGWAAVRRLKADERTLAIPIVALTGYSAASHVRRAQEAGCDAFLTKPCLPSALLAILRGLLAHARPRSSEQP
jgi:CheY-like chemotaxis protein